jgi:hypothetical protein
MCAIHCLAAPLAVVVLPLAALTAETGIVEWGLLLVSLTTSAVVLGRGCVRQHRQWRILAPFAAGAAAVLWSRLAEESYPASAQLAVVAGAMAMITSHVLSIRWCRRSGAVSCARPAPAHRVVAASRPR